MCSSAGRGMLSMLNLSLVSSWTRYSRNLTASTTTPLLIFGFETENSRTFYLDDVSVTDVISPNVELLENPSFENSTLTLTGWNEWCSSSCSSTVPSLSVGGNCYGSAGVCFTVKCSGSGISFFGQSFSAVINHTYTLGYWLKGTGGGGGAGNQNHIYVDIN